MKLIVFKEPLKLNRQVELNPVCMEASCNVVHFDNKENEEVTALYWACRTAQSKTALLLLNSGARVGRLSKRSDGQYASALFWAANNGMNRVVKRLLELGQDIPSSEGHDSKGLK